MTDLGVNLAPAPRGPANGWQRANPWRDDLPAPWWPPARRLGFERRAAATTLDPNQQEDTMNQDPTLYTAPNEPPEDPDEPRHINGWPAFPERIDDSGQIDLDADDEWPRSR